MAPLAWRKCRLSFAGTSRLAELVRLSRTSIADEMRVEHRRRVLGVPLHIDLVRPSAGRAER
jgi:hypothetical protein